MSRLIITEAAAESLERCRLFLEAKNPNALNRAAQRIEYQFELLSSTPNMGRPLSDLIELRELIIPFGSSGYIALYHYEPNTDTVYVLAFRHQKEVGY